MTSSVISSLDGPSEPAAEDILQEGIGYRTAEWVSTAERKGLQSFVIKYSASRSQVA